MMKDQPSFSDVEQLLAELAQQDCRVSAQDDAQTELMRAAARAEIRRVFRRRRYLRLAGSTAMLLLLGGGASLLLPEPGAEAPTLATALPATHKSLPANLQEGHESLLPTVSYTATISQQGDTCDVVIYSVPL